MFDNLGKSLGNIFNKLKGKGFLSEEDVSLAMREVRIALLEADVSLPVVKDFISKIREKAVGEEVIKSVSPAQMVIKIVHDELKNILGGEENAGLNLRANPPVVVMMVGLQGSGKTTSTAKIALQISKRQRKKALMASLDIYRPAAQQQLETLGVQSGIATLPITQNDKPIEITKKAMEKAKLEGYDILFLDTAGRLHIDQEMMAELAEIKKLSAPAEILLVADSLTGQDAINIATQFNEKMGLTGIVLTRIDGDARGGAALSMKAATGCPIKYLGTGEKLDELEEFHPDRIASRILDKGDVISLVEKAAENIDKEEAEKLAKKIQRGGGFDFNDLAKQLETIKKMGGMGGLMNLIPGIGKIKNKMKEANVDEKMVGRQQAIIYSMTKRERRDPKLLNGSRKRRIASGSGTSVQEINRLIKQMRQMQSVMKKMGKMGGKSLMSMAMRGGFKDILPM